MTGCSIFTIALWIQTIMVPFLAILIAIEAYLGYQMAKRLMMVEIELGAIKHMIGVEDIRFGPAGRTGPPYH